MKILDLFCGRGFVSEILHKCFPESDITGVDLIYQNDYKFNFIHSDFRNINIEKYNFIWASPPCQKYSKRTPINMRERYPDLIYEIREKISCSNYIIENVPGSPLNNPIKLNGYMFNSCLYRSRWFESNMKIKQPLTHRPKYDTVNFEKLKKKDILKIFGYENMKCNLKELNETIPAYYINYLIHQVKLQLLKKIISHRTLAI